MGDVTGIKEDLWNALCSRPNRKSSASVPSPQGATGPTFMRRMERTKKKNKSRKAGRFLHEGVKAGEGPTLKPPPAASCP